MGYVHDLNDHGEMWSPDHASLLTNCAKIKNAAGMLDDALTDVDQACLIYDRLGGIEFRYNTSTGCDSCGKQSWCQPSSSTKKVTRMVRKKITSSARDSLMK